jgi:hypothetical protein
MTPGTKSGGGAEKDKHSAENDKKVPKMTKSKCRKKVPKQVATRVCKGLPGTHHNSTAYNHHS